MIKRMPYILALLFIISALLVGCGEKSVTESSTNTDYSNNDHTINNASSSDDDNSAFSSNNEASDSDVLFDDVDLNNIGFYDLMGYTEWCKCKSIHTNSQGGYVEIESEEDPFVSLNKYEFSGQYCKVFSYRASIEGFTENYNRLFSISVVDNDNAIFTPESDSRRSKWNLQIKERELFGENQVFLMIYNSYYGGEAPFVPYDYIDWESGGEFVSCDNHTEVYRFNLK